MTTNHLKQLIRFTRNITLVFWRRQGRTGRHHQSIENLLPEGANVRCIPLPDGEDPDSFARKLSPDKLKQYIKNTEVDFLSFLVDIYKEIVADPIKSEETLSKLFKITRSRWKSDPSWNLSQDIICHIQYRIQNTNRTTEKN